MKNEKYEFLFIDIEWNQKEGSSNIKDWEPVQIGLLAANANLEYTRIFSKSIGLDDIDSLTEQTCKFSHTSKATLMQALPEIEVFKRVYKTFPSYKYIVVWTTSTYELFKRSMNKAGITMPKHNVLILQNILSKIAMEQGKNIGFETALIKAKIPYEKTYLHYSKHDVKYLYELFKFMHDKYASLTQDEYCMVNHRSKIIHACNCSYLNGTNHELEKNKKQLLFVGYRSCRRCGSADVWRRIRWEPVSRQKRNKVREEEFRELPLTDLNIQLICNQFGIKCSIGDDIVFLTTNCGYWRIYKSGNKVDSVYHGNFRMNEQQFKKHKKYNEGFHKQDVSMENFYDVVRYIYYHDKYSYKKRKKSRIELLFDQIEQERLMKEAGCK